MVIVPLWEYPNFGASQQGIRSVSVGTIFNNIFGYYLSKSVYDCGTVILIVDFSIFYSLYCDLIWGGINH